MKTSQWTALAALFAISTLPAMPALAMTNSTGFVTPTALTITFTSLSLVTADNKSKSLISGTFAQTFNRTDSDFAAVSLAGITVPEGRYIGVSICYNTDRAVKLDNVKYDGSNSTSGPGLNNGDKVSSIGTNALTAGSIQKVAGTPPAATTMSGDVVGSGSNNCSQSYFNSPVCVAAGGSGCSGGDIVVDPGTTPPNLNIILDMYHSVGIDANNMSVDNHVPIYPYPTIGRPGAAIHLTAISGSSVNDMSLLFDASKKLMFSSAYGNSSLSGVCSGVGAVSVTAGPAGAFVNSYGPTWVQTFDATTGKLQFASGNCPSGASCTSGGIDVLDNVLHAAGGAVNVTCVADSAATPPFLGFTYAAGAAGSGAAGSTAFTIARIVDPGNILGQCPAGAATTVAGHTGTCSTITTGDGYP